MPVCIALLRGINVGGHNLIKMPDLKRMFEALGFGRVQTLIQSGNVLFESADDLESLRRRIELKIAEVFGFSVTVIMRTATELEEIVRRCPFVATELPEGEGLYVSLLADAPSPEGINRLCAYDHEVDECRLVGREAYIVVRQGMQKSRFTNNFLEQKLGVRATTRNWQTLKKLADLGKSQEQR